MRRFSCLVLAGGLLAVAGCCDDADHHDLWELIVANAGVEAARVEVTYEEEVTGDPVVKTYDVPAGERDHHDYLSPELEVRVTRVSDGAVLFQDSISEHEFNRHGHLTLEVRP